MNSSNFCVTLFFPKNHADDEKILLNQFHKDDFPQLLTPFLSSLFVSKLLYFSNIICTVTKVILEFRLYFVVNFPQQNNTRLKILKMKVIYFPVPKKSRNFPLFLRIFHFIYLEKNCKK